MTTGGTDNGVVAALSDAEVRDGLARLPGWERDGDSIRRDYELTSFRAVIEAVVRIADAAEAADHHPDLDIRDRHLLAAFSTPTEGATTGHDPRLRADAQRRAGVGGPAGGALAGGRLRAGGRQRRDVTWPSGCPTTSCSSSRTSTGRWTSTPGSSSWRSITAPVHTRSSTPARPGSRSTSEPR